jgi:hypothetical protein
MNPVVLNYGGGTNSTALLVGMRDRGERADLIRADESQMKLFKDRTDLPCGCYDG